MANPERDAEKCRRFSDDITLHFFDSRADSDFRSSRPKIIRLKDDCLCGMGNKVLIFRRPRRKMTDI
ncbi:hypothetical protein C7U61_01740 [Rhizobium sp. JAB6]|nr:hypothetical protein C7U61_01740 [Rhizobium sp. JAB6]